MDWEGKPSLFITLSISITYDFFVKILLKFAKIFGNTDNIYYLYEVIKDKR